MENDIQFPTLTPSNFLFQRTNELPEEENYMNYTFRVFYIFEYKTNYFCLVGVCRVEWSRNQHSVSLLKTLDLPIILFFGNTAG